MWLSKQKNKKRKYEPECEEEEQQITFPFNFGKMGASHVNTINNRIYFNDNITTDSVALLNKELRHMEEKMLLIGQSFKIDPPPIYLYLTTDGGEIHSALSVVDCITKLKVPVYTVVDGFVASAGTLISIAGVKRYMLPNAYMLIHELRSGVWGKMSEITEEYENLKKIMEHLIRLYTEKTKLNSKQLEKVLTKDSIWNTEECLKKGLIDMIM